MKILFLASAFNGMTQRAWIELDRLDHQVKIHLMGAGASLHQRLEAYQPDLIVAPFLKVRIPEPVWRHYTCFVVHPGPPGDRGASSLDWALLEQRSKWGVTVLQATEKMDAGPIWAWQPFTFPAQRSKAAIYRREVTDAAMKALLQAIVRFEQGLGPLAPPPEPWPHTGWRRKAQPDDFSIDWRQPTHLIAQRIRAADSSPGAPIMLAGHSFLAFDAHPAKALHGTPGQLLAHRHGAICVATADGAIWIGHLRVPQPEGIKLPAAIALQRAGLATTPARGTIELCGQRVPDLPENPFDICDDYGYRQIRYKQEADVGFLHFEFYNGAMSTDHCHRLLAAFRQIQAEHRPRVLVLMGGTDLWSNGIHLNIIEASPQPEQEAWHNILAIDALIEALIRDTDRYLIAALQGNAGAGGVALALAADKIVAREGIVLNPHTRNMGLYGSEFWTYLLPRRIGTDKAQRFTEECLPWGTALARQTGLIDEVWPAASFTQQVHQLAHELVQLHWFDKLLMSKRFQRRKDEAYKPLATYREAELEQMHRNFFEDNLGFRQKRKHFVFKQPDPELVRQLMDRDWYSARRQIYRYRRYEAIHYEEVEDKPAHRQ